jgi:hypothetical protein
MAEHAAQLEAKAEWLATKAAAVAAAAPHAARPEEQQQQYPFSRLALERPEVAAKRAMAAAAAEMEAADAAEAARLASLLRGRAGPSSFATILR